MNCGYIKDESTCVINVNIYGWREQFLRTVTINRNPPDVTDTSSIFSVKHERQVPVVSISVQYCGKCRTSCLMSLHEDKVVDWMTLVVDWMMWRFCDRLPPETYHRS